MMANWVVSWDVYWTVDRTLYQAVNWALYRAASPAVYEGVCRDVNWAVDTVVGEAVAPCVEPPHLGLALYLGSVP